MRRSMMRVAAVLAAASWVPCVAAVSAFGQVELSTAVEPTVLTYPQQRVLTYRLSMTTGDSEQRLSVAPGRVPFAHGGVLSLEGPGVLGFGIHGDPGAHPRECPRLRTFPGIFQYYTVTLPANSTSVLVSRYKLIAAPWPRSDFRLEYVFDSFSQMPSSPITFVGPVGLRSPPPKVTGRSGVRITLATRPRSKSSDAPARVRLGRSVLVRGRTEPAVAGERIILRASRSADSRRAFTVARVRVAADGRFRDRWQPKRRGRYWLYAIYQSRRAELSNDSTPCNLPIEVR